MLDRPLFLLGFMGAGKSTVGSLLAAELGCPFVDLDKEIVGRAGLSISEIFAKEGEEGFRKRETQALRELQSIGVVATGGGVVEVEENWSVLQEGLTCHFFAGLEVLKERVHDGRGRPNWDDGVNERYWRRLPAYFRCQVTIDSEQTPERIVKAVLEWLRKGKSRDAWVNTSVPYPIVSGDIEEWSSRVVDDGKHLILLVDENVQKFHGERLTQAFGTSPTVIVPSGEESKSLSFYENAVTEVIKGRATRSSLLVAVGGGVVGDLGGFLASTLFRGIEYIQVPTTLLSMVDSAIGGKTGVNLDVGKNLLGTIWQPKSVFIDTAFLSSLPAREVRSGWGEICKYGLLMGEPALTQFESFDGDDLVKMSELIQRCAGFKAGIVSADERETRGVRILLNLGHTVGHAIEKSCQGISHGEAVGLGLIASARIAENSALERRICKLLTEKGLRTDLEACLAGDWKSYIKVDKKSTSDGVRFVVPLEPGYVRVQQISFDTLVRKLEFS